MRLFTTVFIVLSMIFLSSCADSDGTDQVQLPAVGTRVIIKQHSYEIISEVTSTANNLVKMDYFWHGEKIYSQKFYRGLLPVWSQEENNVWEMYFDESKLDSLFPMAPGKEVSFNATSSKVADGTSQDIGITLSVIKETVITIKDQDHKVFILELSRVGDGTDTSHEVLYYAPRAGMVLKSVKRERDGQSYWRVLKIEVPDRDDRSTIKKRQRRSGTIAI